MACPTALPALGAIKERLYPNVNYPSEGLLLRPFLAFPVTANRPRYDAYLIKKTCGICAAAFTRLIPVLWDFLLQCRRSLMPVDLQLLTIQLSLPDEGRGPLRLLIVDDDVVHQELLKRAAGRAGYEISVAASCREAIGWIQSESFDCVILDLELEDGDGTDVCKVMAETNYMGSIIIISGTEAARRSAARAFARSLGIEAQGLPKPVDLASLRICLANLRKDLQGLPAIHAWGGAAVGRTKEEHRN